MVSVGVIAPAAIMVAIQFLNVGLTTLVKSATTGNAMTSNLVFVVYSSILALFFLIPFSLLYYRKSAPPSLSFSMLSRMFLQSCICTAMQTTMYSGVGYSSPTLAAAMVDLVPAFTLILAIVSRMEILNLKLRRGQVKVIGTVVSIAGALVVTLYKGMPLDSGSLANNKVLLLSGSESGSYLTAPSDWIFGAFLLATSSFCVSLLLIVQTWIIKDYPEELVVITICCSFVVIQSAIVAVVAEGLNPKAWILKADKELLAVFYSGFLNVAVGNVVNTWVCRKKGPVFVAMFNPLGMVIALGMGVMFLGEGLYLGSLIGAATIGIGFYAVMWAQAQEENMVNEKNVTCDSASSSTAPLLANKIIDV